jgi:hypothetical protein
MVNGPLPGDSDRVGGAYGICKEPSEENTCSWREHRKRPASYAFVQILGKFYFFNLLENLRRILLDYGQKRSGTANATFKAAC